MTAALESLMLPKAHTFAVAEHGAFIDGAETGVNEHAIDTLDPATGQVITRVADTDAPPSTGPCNPPARLSRANGAACCRPGARPCCTVWPT